MQITNWGELKEFVNNLTNDQLKTKFVIEVAEQPWKKNIFVRVAEDDYLINKYDSEDHGNREELLEQLRVSGCLEDVEVEDDYEVLNRKGEPVLSCDN